MKQKGKKNHKVNPIMRSKTKKKKRGAAGPFWLRILIATNILSLYKLRLLYPQPHFPYISQRCLWKAFGHFNMKKLKKKKRRKTPNAES